MANATKTSTKKVQPVKVEKAEVKGEHIKASLINLPSGRQRRRAVWEVAKVNGRREGTVYYRGKVYRVKEKNNGSWDVVKTL